MGSEKGPVKRHRLELRFGAEGGEILTLAEFRLLIIELALRRYDGNITETARRLKIRKGTIYSAIEDGKITQPERLSRKQ